MVKKIVPIIVILLIIIVILVVFLSKNKTNYNFSIYFFDAGKADAMIIKNNDKYIMIDTAEESLSDKIIDYFKKNNITNLDYLIITHFDKDHVGSAANIIKSINVDKVLQSNYPKDSIYYNNYIETITSENIKTLTIIDDYSFDLGDMKVIVNGPGKTYDKNESNNSSLITKIYYKNNSFIFMGDSENARLKDFISTNNETFDFIKIPYHGRKLKRMNELIENIKPKYAAITSGAQTDNNDTLNVLNTHHVKTYLTKNGSFYVYSDGSNIKVD